jgi:hypothetical protein
MTFDRASLSPQTAGPQVQPMTLSPGRTSVGNPETLLPPSARRGRSEAAASSAERPANRKWCFAGLVALGIGMATWFHSGVDETKCANWKHHQDIAQQADHSAKWLAQSGAVGFIDQVVASRADIDQPTTINLRKALQRNDVKAANQILQDAQRVATHSGSDPGPGAKAGGKLITDPQSKALKPQLTPQMCDQILYQRAQMVQVGLFDSCQEDGDVVEILVNGTPYCEVPLTKAGAIVSVPVVPGTSTVLAIRGTRDGTGGITVGCWTSQGQGFLRVMAPGEVESLGVVLP